MTIRENTTPEDARDYECIDPGLGEQMWRRQDPDCEPELRARLEAHLRHCARCRLDQAVEERVATGLDRGELKIAPGHGGSRTGRWLSGVGAAALAAGLALLLLMPPRAPHRDLVVRGGEQPAIESPVPDEVVLGVRPRLRWTDLDGATRYRLQLTMVDGDYNWSATTTEPQAIVPEDRELPRGARFRLEIDPVPAHAAPEGALRTSFRTGGAGDWFAYRLRRGAPAGRWLAVAGLAGSLLGLGLGFAQTRRG